MLPRTPQGVGNQDQLNKSFNTVLTGNVSPGNGLTFDAQGIPTTFSNDNMVGIIIRIGSLANPNMLPASWPGNNINLTIAHNLNQVPTGFIVVQKFAPTDVWFSPTVAPTTMNITLQTSNDATDVAIWILI